MGIILTIPILIFLVCGAFTLLSFAFAWYENANREPRLLEERFAPENLLLALRLLILESGFLFVTVLLHPLGWFSPKELKTDREGGIPVILLHGLFQSRACWTWTRYQLRPFGYRNVYSIPLPPWKDIETLTERVARTVDEVRHALDVEKVILIGHSMGGIVARNYLQLCGGAPKVAGCLLLAVPHGGSKLVPFALSPLGKLVMPGSAFLQRLGSEPLPAGVAFTSIHTRHDNIVLPWENARLPGAETVELEGIGHTGLLFHSGAFDALLRGLKGVELDHP
jgi:pimeloyl-ACP methyl ester carboxylesterase